jgi:polysaccharide export outer membrane protein
MSKMKKVLMFVMLVSFALPLPLWAEEENGNYLIGPGDVLDISVWKDETLTRSVVVLPDNRISFPLIGEVTAGGRKVTEVKKEIQEKLGRFVSDITLSLEVKQVNSMIIYVIGRVNTPGKFPLNANVDVLQALAMGGGCNPFAKKDKIKIFRRENGKTHIFYFQYDSVVDGKRMEDNITLQRGDVVVVP